MALTADERRERLLQLLSETDGWATAAELGMQLGVGSRSIRAHVRELNAHHGAQLVASGQQGYRLNRAEYRHYRERRALRRSHAADTRDERRDAILHRLVTGTDGLDVFAVADDLAVSPSTIEADLGRIRAMVAAHGLALERERDTVRLVGSERERRRLVRSFILERGGMAIRGLDRLDDAVRGPELRQLHAKARRVLARSDLEVNEYALNDILLHIAIAAHRVGLGHRLDQEQEDGQSDRALWPVVEGLRDAVAETHGIQLPPSELDVLHSMLMTHTSALAPATRARLQSELPMRITRDALRVVAAEFGLDLYDEPTVTRLAMHVQNLIARSREGRAMASPLGVSFRASHPFIHEIALLVAREIEAVTGIDVGDGEVDFLAFHLGNQVQRQLDHGPPVTITCVVPQYGALHHELVDALARALGDQAVVRDVVTSLMEDWSGIDSDLIVSVVPLPADVPVPVLRVSPFLTEDDIARVVARVQQERSRVRREKLAGTMLSLTDPALFHIATDIASSRDAIHVLCERLRHAGYVAGDFEEDVLERERRAPTAFGGELAIPHSLYADAMRTGIAVLLVPDGVPWGPSEAVRLVLLFAVSPDGRPVFRDVLDELATRLHEPASVAALVRARSHQEFTAALSALLVG